MEDTLLKIAGLFYHHNYISLEYTEREIVDILKNKGYLTVNEKGHIFKGN